MSGMTTQQAFDAMARGILKQGRPAWDSLSSSCKYRAVQADGAVLKCAIGQIIPDEMYTPVMDKTGLMCVIQDLANAGILDGSVDTYVISRAQSAHDRNALNFVTGHHSIDSWREGFIREMTSMADDHGLDPAVLSEGWEQ